MEQSHGNHIQPILIEPISTEHEIQVGNKTSDEPRNNGETLPAASTPGILYQMVNVNVNGVVKNLMIPFPQSVSNSQNVSTPQNSATSRINVPFVNVDKEHNSAEIPTDSVSPQGHTLRKSFHQVNTVNVSSQGFPTFTSTPSTSVALSTFKSLPSVPRQHVQTTVPSDSFQSSAVPGNASSASTKTLISPPTSPTLPTVLGQPLQKICLTDSVKEQLLLNTSNGRKVSVQIGQGTKKTLVFRSENGKLVGQMQRPITLPTSNTTTPVTKSAISRTIVHISPCNKGPRIVQPINIVPSNVNAGPQQAIIPSPPQGHIKVIKPTAPSNISDPPKPPKIVIVNQTSNTSKEKSFLTFPLQTSVQMPNPVTATKVTLSTSPCPEKLCSIASVVSLKEQSASIGNLLLQTQVRHTPQETLRSLLNVSDERKLFNNPPTSSPTFYPKCKNDQPNSFPGNKDDLKSTTQDNSDTESDTDSKFLNSKKRQDIKCEDMDWEPSIPDCDLIQWNDATNDPIIRKIHDAVVRPYYGCNKSPKVKKKKKISRRREHYDTASFENISHCKLGCIGCQEPVKRKRKKKKHNNIFANLRADHPELKKCSVVIEKISNENAKFLPNKLRPQLAKKSTTKSSFSFKQRESSSSIDQFGLDTNYQTFLKSNECTQGPDNQNVPQTLVNNPVDENLSKKKYLMIKTNAGTFLIPTDSSQPPMILNGNTLQSIHMDETNQTNFDASRETLNRLNNCDEETVGNFLESLTSKGKVNPQCKTSDDPFSQNCEEEPNDNIKNNDTVHLGEKPLVRCNSEKPVERIKKLKEKLKLQQQDMENAKKMVESSRNILNNIDD